MKKRPKVNKKKLLCTGGIHNSHTVENVSSRSICTVRVKSLEPGVMQCIEGVLRYLAAHGCFDLILVTQDRGASVVTACIKGEPFVPAILQSRITADFRAEVSVMAATDEHLLRA